MAISFQYNKTAMQSLSKQLKVRQKALPTLKNKESALRMEVKKAKDKAIELDKALQAKLAEYDSIIRLYGEFENDLVAISDVNFKIKKIAGVQTPVLDDIVFAVRPFSVFSKPQWFLDGIAMTKEMVTVAIEREFFLKKMELLDYSRRKTTQKVNLYEKVQIPGYQEALLKIKRFLEDEENLSKSAQKIVKSRQMAEASA
jgi:V/A-type H+-transporting ATPase subunit D